VKNASCLLHPGKVPMIGGAGGCGVQWRPRVDLIIYGLSLVIIDNDMNISEQLSVS